MWISKQEYEEGGKQCVDRKCPWFIFFYSTATLIMFSSWTLWKGQHLLWYTSDPGLRNTSRLLSLLLYILFCFFKYKYLYVHEASFLGVLWTSTKWVILWWKKKWVVFSSTSVCCLENDLLKPVFNFDCYHKHSDCSYSISIQTMTFI